MKALWIITVLPFLMAGTGHSGKSEPSTTAPVQPACALVAEDCSDGIARLNCHIWHVIVKATLGATLPKIEITCQTGGNYQCDLTAFVELMKSADGKNEEPE